MRNPRTCYGLTLCPSCQADGVRGGTTRPPGRPSQLIPFHDALVASYQQGATLGILAQQLGVAHTTILRYLKQQGVLEPRNGRNQWGRKEG